MPILTVTQINRYLSFKIKEDKALQGIMVKGEISNFTNHYCTGHLYFSLKDGESSVKAVMFASAANRLKFEPEDGMKVIVSGSVSVYERDGIYQLYVTDICPDGIGGDYLALQQLKEKLSQEGVFDTAHKRPLPEYPKIIGIVTSKTGAVVRDVINVLSRRYPIGELYISDAQVQGANAPDAICKGISEAESYGCDVIIVGRGGGSSEDLSAFNTEKVAYAIYNCTVPVVSAVGHETDFTVADLVADVRAATPSAAAELSAPDISHLAEKVDILLRRLNNGFDKTFDGKASALININSRLLHQSPQNRLKSGQERLSALEMRLNTAFTSKTGRANEQIERCLAKLDSLSPVKVLARGYSLVYKDGRLVNNAEMLISGDEVHIKLGSGEIKAHVI